MTRTITARDVLPYLPALAIIAVEWTLLSPVPAVADHFQFWAAGHIAATGGSPYARDSWIAMAAYGEVAEGVAVNTIIQNLPLTQQVWLYPPQTAFALALFGVLPLPVGIPLLHLVVLVTAMLGIALGGAVVGLRGAPLAFGLAICAASQAFLISVRDGHPIGVVLLGAALMFVGTRERRYWLLAVGVILLSLKPQVALVFALASAAYMIARDRKALGVALAAGLSVTIPAEIAQPFPLEAISSAVAERSALNLSSTSALARDLGDGLALSSLIVLAAVVASVLALWWSPQADRPHLAFGATLALSLVVVPYTHDYDQVLLLPATLSTLALVRDPRSRILVGSTAALLLTLGAWILFFWWPLAGEADRVQYGGPLGALPPLALLILMAAAWSARTHAPGRAEGRVVGVEAARERGR